VSFHASVRRAEELLGHRFSDQTLIEAALTHPSARTGLPASFCYERLEFLGDSILGAVIATELFKRFPELDEGKLTLMKVALVSGRTLSEVADGLGIGELIRFGDSELGTGSRGMRSALENVYESLVGALYLDGGFDVTHEFILRTLGPQITDDLARDLEPPKSRLQEAIQRDYHTTPTYKVVDQCGPRHSPTFTSVVLVDGVRQGRGKGSSKKESETNAALDALVRMGYQVESEADTDKDPAEGAGDAAERA
jgi:ribonuclease-3